MLTYIKWILFIKLYSVYRKYGGRKKIGVLTSKNFAYFKKETDIKHSYTNSFLFLRMLLMRM